MPITIKDLLDPQECKDGYVVNRLVGTVKIAWPVKPATSRGDQTFGQSQGFVLANADGEIQCQLKDTASGGGFAPVAKGDQLEILSTPHGKTGVQVGNKLRSYEKDGKTVRCLDIHGLRHLKNLSQSADLQPAYTGTEAAAQGKPDSQRRENRPPGLTESQAVDTYWRIFSAIAGKFAPKVSATATSVEGFIIEADVALLDIVHRAALTIYIGIQDGKVTAEPKAAGKGRAEPEADDDIPF